MSVAIFLRHVGAMFEQQLDNLALPLGSALMQGRELPEVACIDRGTMLDEQLCHLKMAITRRTK